MSELLTRRTPTVGVTGAWSLQAPWVANPTKVYTCEAVRLFPDLQVRSIDPLGLAYTPYGAESTAYEADLAAGAAIVTLLADDGSVIYVPDTRIISYPNMGNYVYEHTVLSVDLFALPSGVALDWLIEQIKEATLNTLGVDTQVGIHTMSTTGSTTPEEHDRIEAARQAKISTATTYKAQVIKLTEENTKLAAQLGVYYELLKKNGIL